jgi:hypothetical protein
VSNQIFPTVPGLSWDIEKTPMYNTIVQIPFDKRKEVRVSGMSQPQYKFKIAYEVLLENQAYSGALSPSFDLSTIEGFYNSMNGAFNSFLLDPASLTRDPNSSSELGQVIGAGDGTTQSFQLTHTVGGFTEELYEIKPGVQLYKSDYQNPTNVATWSEDFTNAIWQKDNTIVITPNVAFDPFGGNNADLYTGGSGPFSALADIFQQCSGDATQTWTFSIWLKSSSASSISVRLCISDFSHATAASPVLTITPAWQRFSFTNTGGALISTTFVCPGIQCRDIGLAPFGTSFYMFGAQLEQSATVSNYAKTMSVGNIGPVPLFPFSRTNLAVSSQDYTTASWSRNNTTITVAATTAPDGSNTGQLVAKNTTTLGSIGQATISSSLFGISYVFFVWLKGSANSTQADFGIHNTTLNSWPVQTVVILNGPGIIATSANTPATITGLSTTRWTRVRVSIPVQAAGTALAPLIYPDRQASVISGNSIYVWGVQVEGNTGIGNLATSYIPTTASTASATDYTLNSVLSGVVTFGFIPSTGMILSGDFGWYYRVRFIDDTSASFNNFYYQLWNMKEITLIQTSN